MQLRHASILGIAILLIAFQASAAPPLYDTMLRFTEIDNVIGLAEPEVELFLSKIYAIQPELVDSVIREQLEKFCTEETKPAWAGTCAEYREHIMSLLRRQGWLRTAIRDMQIAATRNEKGAEVEPGQIDSVLARIVSILNIWQGGGVSDEAAHGAYAIRGASWTIAMEMQAQKLASVLQSLLRTTANGKIKREVFDAAIWRYRYGIPSDAACDPAHSGRGDGTPLQFLTARWCDVEAALVALLQAVDPTDRSPDVVFPSKVILAQQGVEVWVRGNNAGLRWTTHLSPVLPSLDCSSEMSYAQPKFICNDAFGILGGTYPDPLPDPAPNTDLCADPFGKRGYLCRSIDATQCPAESGDTVALARCAKVQMIAPTRITSSGPDICMEKGWQLAGGGAFSDDTPIIDDGLERGLCANCVVDLYCDDQCGKDGYTYAKDVDGKIKICIGNASGAKSAYTIIHELVHATQFCNEPLGSVGTLRQTLTTQAGCCALEYQANLVGCTAMAEDGIFKDLGYSPHMCAAALSNIRCGGEEKCAVVESSLTSAYVLSSIEEALEKHAPELGLPTNCQDAIQYVDKRALNMKESLNQVCTPLCKTRMENTVEANACLVGECIEQTVEWHHWIPGRTAGVTGDQSFPWDSGAIVDPTYRAFFSPIASAKVPIPAYWPRWLIQQLDLAFCQAVGHGKYALPHRCNFDPQRATKLQAPSYGAFIERLLDQGTENEEGRIALRNMAPGIGARIGSRLFADYLEANIRPLTEAVRATSRILKLLAEASFPTHMCSRNDVADPLL